MTHIPEKAANYIRVLYTIPDLIGRGLNVVLDRFSGNDNAVSLSIIQND